MNHCPRCGADVRGHAWCGRCGQQLAGQVGPSGAGRQHRVPGPLVAVQVLLGLGVVGSLVWAVISFVGASFASSFGTAIDGTAGDDGTGLELRSLAGWMVVLAVVFLVFAVVDLWAMRAVGAGDPRARTILTVLRVADAVLCLALTPLLGAQVLVSLLVGLPGGAALLLLLWLPESSKQHFGGPARPGTTADSETTDVLAIPARYLSNSRSAAPGPVPRHSPRPGWAGNAPSTGDEITGGIPRSRPRPTVPATGRS